MIVLKMTFEQLDSLHQQTECGFFKHNPETGKANTPTIQQDSEGFYIYGLGKFTSKYPNIDISGIPQIEYVPITEDI